MSQADCYIPGERRAIRRGISPGIDGARRHASGKALNRLDLIERLSAVSPALALKQRSHVRSFGFLVHHVFLADVLSRIGDCLGPAAQVGDDAEARALLATVERGIERGDAETKDLLAQCFEQESGQQPFFEALKPLAGPRLHALLRAR